MTEDEARTKWCPQMQICINDGKFATNRGHVLKDGELTSLKCIASDCMMWTMREEVTYEPSSSSNVKQKVTRFTGGCGLIK